MAAPMQGYFPRDPSKGATLLDLPIDVKRDYNASGSAESTTGSIDSGSTTLTLAAAKDFKNGQGISVAGAGVSGALLVTSIVSGGGTTTLTLADAAGTTVSGATVQHDDTTAMKDAISAAATAGAMLYVPPGTYLLQDITISSSVRIVGDASRPTLSFQGTTALAVQASNTTMRNLTLSGAGNTSIAPNNFDAVVQVGSNSISQLTGVVVEDCTLSGSGGLIGQNLSAARVDNNNFTGASFQYTYAVLDSAFNGNTITGSGVAQIAGGATLGTSNDCKRIQANNNAVNSTSSNAGIFFDAVAGGVIAGNTIIGPADMGIDVEHSSDIAVGSNHVVGTGRYGIALFQHDLGCTVSGNTIEGTTSTGDYAGIYVATADGSNAVVGNSVRSCAGLGIYVDGAGETAVTGNTVMGSGGIGVSVLASDGCIVADNILDGNEGSVELNQCNQATISHNYMKNGTVSVNNTLLISGGSGYSNCLIEGNIFVYSSGSSFAMNLSMSDVDCYGNIIKGFGNTITGGTRKANNQGYNPIGYLSSQPSVPSSGTAYTNGQGVQCRVFVSGGTVSAIAINGTGTGLTSGTFELAVGDTITLTYTSAPTWKWFGL